MAPRLRVLAGTSPETMAPITSIVNTGGSHKLSSDIFEGEIVAHIKNFVDESGRARESEYFSREDRQGVTWSIQVQGRFLRPYSADDILFGNTFDRPLKLPWGTGAVFKFMNYIDPTLEHDLQSNTKPWALSPLVSTMPYLMHRRMSREHPPSGVSLGERAGPFPTAQSIIDSTPDLYKTFRDRTHSSGSSISSSSSSASSTLSSLSTNSIASSGSKKSDSLKSAIKKVTPQKRKKAPRAPSEEVHFENSAARRSYFSNPTNRQAVVFGPSDIITTDFCYGFIEFSPSLALRLPGGLSFDLMRYWDGQPVRFMCCERKEPGSDQSGGDPWGRTFWCIAIESYDDEEDNID